MPGLTGLAKDKVEKRLSAATQGQSLTGGTGGGNAALRSRTIDLLALVANQHKGNSTKDGLIMEPRGMGDFFVFPYQPPGEYDLEFAFTSSRSDDPEKKVQSFTGELPKAGESLTWMMRSRPDGAIVLGLFLADHTFSIQATLPPKMTNIRKFTVLLQVRREGTTFVVNGEELATTHGYDGFMKGGRKTNNLAHKHLPNTGPQGSGGRKYQEGVGRRESLSRPFFKPRRQLVQVHAIEADLASVPPRLEEVEQRPASLHLIGPRGGDGRGGEHRLPPPKASTASAIIPWLFTKPKKPRPRTASHSSRRRRGP